MSPVGDAGLEQIMARLIELEAHLDAQDDRIANLRLAFLNLRDEIHPPEPPPHAA